MRPHEWGSRQHRKGTRSRVPKSRIPPPLFFCLWDFEAIGGGVGIEFGGGDEVGADRVLVDVVAAGFEVVAIKDEVVGVAALPDRILRGDAAGESALDEVHGLRDGFAVGREEQVNVVGHDDEGVEFVCALGAVVLESFEEEVGVRGKLEYAATIVGDGGDEECS